MEKIQTIHLPKVIELFGRDMHKQSVAITGTTSGTGYICAKELAKLGAKVFLLNRSSKRSETSFNKLKTEVPTGDFVNMVCDLQDFESVRNAAKQIKSITKVLDILVNNAGIMAMPAKATKDGYDVQMQTNVLSHFLLTKELFPILLKSKQARIVNHSSMARLGRPLDKIYFEKQSDKQGGDGTEEENVNFTGPRWQRYHQTKLANAAFTYGLKEKLKAKGIEHLIPLLAHPGLAATNLQVTTAQNGGMDLDAGFMQRAQSSADGAGGILRACLDIKAKSGCFYGPTEGWKGFPDLLEPEELLFDKHNIETNWIACENAVGEFNI